MTYIEAKGLLLANKDQACKKAKQKGNQRSSSCQQGSTPSHDHVASRLVKISKKSELVVMPVGSQGCEGVPLWAMALKLF